MPHADGSPLAGCSAALGAFFNDPKGQACDKGQDVPYPQVRGGSSQRQLGHCKSVCYANLHSTGRRSLPPGAMAAAAQLIAASRHIGCFAIDYPHLCLACRTRWAGRTTRPEGLIATRPSRWALRRHASRLWFQRVGAEMQRLHGVGVHGVRSLGGSSP